MKIECLNGPVCAEENNTRTLTLTVDAAFSGYEIRLGLLTPAGRRCLTPEISLSDGVGTFALPATVLDAPGLLLAQIIAENSAGLVAKSEIFAFPVERSIPVGAAQQTSDGLITLAALHNAVTALEAFAEGLPPAAKSGSYTDLTDRPLIPTVPANVSAFVNDAGYLTAHQSLDGYATLAAVNEAVAAAALDANGIAVDAALSGSSENPVQNKAVQAALDGKQDTLITASGTFTPNFTPETGSNFTVKQIGNVVFVSGTLVASGALSDANAHHLGDINGVSAPVGPAYLPVLTWDGVNWHAGTLVLAENGGSVYVGMNVTETDDLLLVNAFYLV